MEQNGQHVLLIRKAVDPDKTESPVKLWLLSGSVNRQDQEARRRNSRKVAPVEKEGEKKSKFGEVVEKLEHTLEKHDDVCDGNVVFVTNYYFSGSGSQFRRNSR